MNRRLASQSTLAAISAPKSSPRRRDFFNRIRPISVVQLNREPSWKRTSVDRIVHELGGRYPSHVSLVPRFGIHDPLLEQLALAMLSALREGPGSALYIDRLAQAMAAHLIRIHSTSTREVRAPRPEGLADASLRRVADQIEALLHTEITLDGMAAEAGLSPLHLIRTFKAAFGKTPRRYVHGPARRAGEVDAARDRLDGRRHRARLQLRLPIASLDLVPAPDRHQPRSLPQGRVGDARTRKLHPDAGVPRKDGACLRAAWSQGAATLLAEAERCR